jgi:hypothetical protein
MVVTRRLLAALACLGILLTGLAVVPQTTSATAAAPRFSSRGIPPRGQTLFGAAVLGDIGALERRVGAPVGVHRSYFQARQQAAAVATVRADLARHRIPWISFKLPHPWAAMAAGKGDAWARDLANRLGAVGGPVWVAFHHEPEGDGPAGQWVALQRRLSPIFRAKPNIAYSIILMGWNQFYSGRPHESLNAYWPGRQYVDILGFDPYNWYGTSNNGSGKRSYAWTELKDYYDRIVAWLRATGNTGVRWAIAETGYTNAAAALPRNFRAPNGKRVSTRGPGADWLLRAYTDMRAMGGVALSYFNVSAAVNGEPGDWTWPLAGNPKISAFARTLRSSNRYGRPVARKPAAQRPQTQRPGRPGVRPKLARVRISRQGRVMALSLTSGQRWTARVLRRSHGWSRVAVRRSDTTGRIRIAGLRRGIYKVRGAATGTRVRTVKFAWRRHSVARLRG